MRSLLFLALGILAICGGCGSVQTEHQENQYSSVLWSPDGTGVVYFKRYVVYTAVTPRVSWFIGEDSITLTLKEDRLFLCFNDTMGTAERVITEVHYPLEQPDPNTIPTLYTAIAWEGAAILYGVGQPDGFSSGVHRINLRGDEDELIEAGFEAVSILGKRRTLKFFNGRELYSAGEGGYGYFGSQTIYIFDHNTRSVLIYLHDPLDSQVPYIPPYSVTGQ